MTKGERQFIPPDIEGLKSFIGGAVLDMFQARGVAQAAAAALAEAEKQIDALSKENAELKERADAPS